MLVEHAPRSVPYLADGLALESGWGNKAYNWLYGRCEQWLPKKVVGNLPHPVDAERRRGACLDALETIAGEIGADAGAAAPALARLVAEAPQEQRRSRAGRILQEIGVGGKAVVERLCDGLEDSDSNVQGWAAVALGEIPEQAGPAVPYLVEALQGSEDDYPKWTAARALGRIGGPAREAVPALKEAMKTGDPNVRVQAAGALWRINTNTADTVPVLIELVEGEDDAAQWIAAKWLGRMGEAAKPAVDSLRQQSESGSMLGRVAATWALWRLGEIGSDKALTVIRSGLDDGDRWTAAQTADMIAELGSDASPLLPDLIDALGANETSVQAEVAKCLGRLGETAREAVPSLQQASRHDEREVAHAAKAAIEKIKPPR